MIVKRREVKMFRTSFLCREKILFCEHQFRTMSNASRSPLNTNEAQIRSHFGILGSLSAYLKLDFVD